MNSCDSSVSFHYINKMMGICNSFYCRKLAYITICYATAFTVFCTAANSCLKSDTFCCGGKTCLADVTTFPCRKINRTRFLLTKLCVNLSGVEAQMV